MEGSLSKPIPVLYLGPVLVQQVLGRVKPRRTAPHDGHLGLVRGSLRAQVH